MDIQASKIELIKIIADIKSERLIEELKKFLKREIKNGTDETKITTEPQATEPEWIRLAREPMPEHLDLDAIAKEQGYDPEKFWEFLENRDPSIWDDENFEELVELMKNDK